MGLEQPLVRALLRWDALLDGVQQRLADSLPRVVTLGAVAPLLSLCPFLPVLVSCGAFCPRSAAQLERLCLERCACRLAEAVVVCEESFSARSMLTVYSERGRERVSWSLSVWQPVHHHINITRGRGTSVWSHRPTRSLRGVKKQQRPDLQVICWPAVDGCLHTCV